ncbi:nicotinate phosphoribosyltransferase [Leucosporidium creatinivorum]|uniref:Nicotinate phosphoribosyltransferase n=1 Tax=Leucosporidium creatinivorum TaxID=106004 RepID=A0A1Y2FZ58_9BASI|nr:nicotinate phosphoribosyltransferase [Leucosporidium creatinivorum]
MLHSVLDSDQYKLSMQQAILQQIVKGGEDPLVAYRFTNRGGNLFTRATYEVVLQAVQDLGKLALTKEERVWLEKNAPFLTADYLDYLETFRYKPEEQVSVQYVVVDKDAQGQELGRFEIEIKGGWAATILYEVPLMAIISEAYFTAQETNWDYVGQYELAKAKGKALFEAGCVTSEFGTRRRRSYEAQDIIMRGLIAANEEFGGEGKGRLAGTSNVHFAQKYNIAPIGTIAHEWIMGVAALTGYEGSNGRAMDLWEKTYPSGALSIALTDTFSTKPFFDDFISDPARANRWKGLRQDSGSPFKFISLAKEAFERVGADPKQKIIVFSDGLDVAKSIELKKASDEAGVGCSFGVGTTFTNDFVKVEQPVKQDVPGEGEPRTGEPSKALNMVIKLYRINNEFCVKISDELTKNTGDEETVRVVKHRFGLE